jgi:aldehyde dehydrogenase (NAD+)
VASLDSVQEFVDIALDDGANLAYGGGPPEEDLGSDLFFLPTIFTDVDNDDYLAQEEVFGPILAVVEFPDEDEAIEIANDVRYGLAGGVWTEDMRRAHRVANRIRAGRIWINNYRNSGFTSPQGGYKDSGWGVENGIKAVEGYLNTKAIWTELSEETESAFRLL